MEYVAGVVVLLILVVAMLAPAGDNPSDDGPEPGYFD